MTMAINSINDRPTDDEADEGAGVEVEITPIDAEAETIEPEAEAEEINAVVAAAANHSNKRLIILCGLVIATVGAVSYVASSSSASSSSKMTNINSNQMQMQMQGGSEFTYVGEGWCLDDNPNDYDDETLPYGNVYPFVGYRYQADANECGEVCAECPGKGQGELVLRGFSFEVFTADPLNSECYCHVDKDSIDSFESFETIAYGVCNAPFSHGDAPFSVGTGEIVDFHYNIRMECWKVSSTSSKSSKAKSSKAKSSKSSSTPSSKGSKSS